MPAPSGHLATPWVRPHPRTVPFVDPEPSITAPPRSFPLLYFLPHLPRKWEFH